uniref:RPN1 N-terminal domain-containing protein n=1 Tax=Panagrolaimus sp. PS1159 TaxID=55785 RepID=A0AC35GNR0_9BILA
AEVEACDLLLEIERLDILLEHIKKEEHERACLYLLSSAPLSPDPDNTNMIKTAMQIYAKFGKELEALRCAIMLNDPALINKLFNSNDNLVLKQMAILLGRHQIFVDNAKLPDGIHDLNNNSHVSKFFRILARELDIMEPKTPEGIYKTHLEQTRPFGSTANNDSSRMNIAASFV